jgi:hypothetical protein
LYFEHTKNRKGIWGTENIVHYWRYTVDLPFGVKFGGSYLLLTILDRILFYWGSSKFIALLRIVTSNI